MSEIQTFYAVQELIAQIKGIRAEFRGKRLAQACFMVSMAFDNSHSWGVRMHLLNAIQIYMNWVPPDAITWWVSEGRHPKDIFKSPIALAKLEGEARNEGADFAFAMGCGSGAIKQRLDVAQEFTMTFLAPPAIESARNGILQLFFPIDWVLQLSGDWSILSLVNGLVERMQPLHATAGIGLVFPQ